MSKILVRADGGKYIGLGHIMRTLVLAKELKKYYEIAYICKDEKEYLAGVEAVEKEGFFVYKVSEINLVADIKNIQINSNAHTIITDSYDINENYFDEMKRIFKVSGYISDGNTCRLNVDFVINQNINANEISYEVNNTTRLFLGTEYCLLREEFRQNINRKIRDKVNNILVTVGGSDKDYNTLKLVKVLKSYDINVHIVIGSAFDENLIRKLEYEAERIGKIQLYKNAKMAELMEACDIVISSCGSTLYEICAMQVPAIGIVVADNQKDICKSFDEKELILGTDNLIYNNLDKLIKVIDKLITNKDLRVNLSTKQKHLVNEYGAEVLANHIYDIIENKDDINGIYKKH